MNVSSGKRLLGLDYGDRRIGVAVSDPFGSMALGVETIHRSHEPALKASLNRIGELLRQYSACGIVLGFPKNMDGTEGQRCAKTLVFKAKLEKTFPAIPVELWDERLSTAGAMRMMSSSSSKSANRGSGAVDEMAAVFILQGYIDYLKNKSKNINRKEVIMTNPIFDDNNDTHDRIISMMDENGNEVTYIVLSCKTSDNYLFMLAVEEVDESAGDDAEAEVLFFKSQQATVLNDADAESDEEITFDLILEEHDDFEKAMELFEAEFEEFGIET